MTSVPGVGVINGAQILARLGDPARFQSLAGARSFTGLVPSLAASGTSGHHGPPTKSGDAPLREALFMAADHARRTDPTLAARYHRLMVTRASTTTPRSATSAPPCSPGSSPAGEPAPPTRSATPTAPRSPPAQGRADHRQRYRVSDELRAQRRTSHTKTGTSRRQQGVARRSDTSPPPHHATTTSRTT